MSTTSRNRTCILRDAEGTVDEFSVVEVMREIEGRRFSGRGLWRGREVFFKIFVAIERVERHVQREKDGCRALQERDIATADIIHEASVEGEGIPEGARCLLFQWISDAENVDKLLHGVISETRALGILRRLAETIGRHHEAGLVQKDLHFGNFATVGDEIYTFDVGSIEDRGNPVTRGPAIDNLALFFAQVDPVYLTKVTLPLLVDTYMKVRRADRERPDLTKLWKRTRKERKRRMEKFLEKVLRPCRLVNTFTTDQGHRALLARQRDCDELRSLVEHIDRQETLADGVHHDFGELACHQRVYRHADTHLFSFSESSPAIRYWQAAQRLLLECVPVVEPLAVMDGGRRDSWILLLQPAGSTLESHVAGEEHDLESVARSVAETLVRLDQLNLRHGRMSRRSFAVWDDKARLTDVEDLKAGEARSLDWESTTSKDMRSMLSAWHGHPFGSALHGALNDHGYAFDL